MNESVQMRITFNETLHVVLTHNTDTLILIKSVINSVIHKSQLRQKILLFAMNYVALSFPLQKEKQK